MEDINDLNSLRGRSNHPSHLTFQFFFHFLGLERFLRYLVILSKFTVFCFTLSCPRVVTIILSTTFVTATTELQTLSEVLPAQ